ncbi:hypothetical protein JYP51_09400 [Ponticoccus gilvus]|nr:hypothetical protein [Enemella evansiae]
MAETGADRTEARDMAVRMAGEEDPRGLVLPEHERDLVRLALATVGKWRTAPRGLGGARLLGFDLAEIDVAARWMGITPDARLLDGIGIIERAALKLLEKP